MLQSHQIADWWRLSYHSYFKPIQWKYRLIISRFWSRNKKNILCQFRNLKIKRIEKRLNKKRQSMLIFIWITEYYAKKITKKRRKVIPILRILRILWLKFVFQTTTCLFERPMQIICLIRFKSPDQWKKVIRIQTADRFLNL